MSRTGSGMDSSTASISSSTVLTHFGSPSRAFRPDVRMTGASSPSNSWSGEQLADLELDELQDLLVVDHVGLVQGDQDVGHADLAGQQHVLLGLRHRAVGGGHHQDRAVHLRRTGDHVLDVVGVTRGVDVGVVTLLRRVLDVRDVDGDTALTLFRRLVDLVERRTPGSASGTCRASTLVMAAVRVVLPWSTWPIVPMLTCGLLRSNFAFATAVSSSGRDDPRGLPDVRGGGGWIWNESHRALPRADDGLRPETARDPPPSPRLCRCRCGLSPAQRPC